MKEEAPFRRRIALNDLAAWSEWPDRLLGLQEWHRKKRTIEKLEQEYDREKYAACTAFLQKNPAATPEDIKTLELGGGLEREICVSSGEAFGIMTLADAWRHYTQCCLSLLLPLVEAADIVCDLGCGYGYHLWLLSQQFPGKEYFGSDLSQNAIHLAEKLFADKPNFSFARSDLTDPHLSLPYGNSDNVLLFSIYAYDNLPSAATSIGRLVHIKGKNWHVCHLEPVFEWCADNLRGRLSRAYTIANDYNRDLFTTLREHPDVNIVNTEREFFGLNPLHPTSCITWR